MTRTKHTPPPFLQRTLDPKKASFVRSKLPDFLKEARLEYHGELPSSKELLYQFCEYLAKYDHKFKNLVPDQLSTGYKGVQQIYDYVRKRAKPLDEKNPNELIRSGKNSPSKQITEKPVLNPDAIAKKKIATPTKVTSTPNAALEPDEKDVKYYVENFEDSASSNTISEQEEATEADQDKAGHWGKSIWLKEKRFIIGLLDTFDPSELANLEFQISTCEEGGR